MPDRPSPAIPVFRGKPYDVGAAHGDLHRETIRSLVVENLESLSLVSERRRGTSIPPDELLRYAEPCLDLLQARLPDLYSETCGIADAVGLSPLEVATLNGYLDLFDLTSPGRCAATAARGGCTDFAVRAGAASGLWSLIGQNYDLRSMYQKGVFLADIQCDGKPRALVATIAGMVGCAGLNEAGVGVVINNLTPTDSKEGLLHQYVVRSILQCTTLSDAVDAVLDAPRASGFNYIITDGYGEFVGLETSAGSAVAVHPGANGFICHSNHYVTDTMRQFEAATGNGDSIVRYGRAQSLLCDFDASDPEGSARAWCADHVNYPKSICRHAVDGHSMTEGKTVFSIIVDSANRSVLFCVGNPCGSEYHEYEL